MYDELLQALAARNFNAQYVASSAEALARVIEMLPPGALVSHGTSATLLQIGLVEWLRATDRVRYGNARWTSIDDPAERARARKELSYRADVYLGSVQAVCRTGQVVGVDASGSRQAPYVWGPDRVIWVVGENKLVDDMEAALTRVREVAYPLEDERMRGLGGRSSISKLVVYERETVPARISMVLVGESLGF
ncbi:MAG: lactate utilization protein [Gaiellales bacterium]